MHHARPYQDLSSFFEQNHNNFDDTLSSMFEEKPEFELFPQETLDNLFNGLNEVINFFDNVFEEKVNYGECYVNFHSNASIKPAHNDKWTAVVLSCIGNIEWRIFDKENYTSYITEPGDVIVIPQGVMHSVVPLEPRLSISLAYKTVDF